MDKINEILDLAFAGCDAADKEEAKEVWRTYNAVYKGVSEFDNQQDWTKQGDAVEVLARAFAVVFERVVASGAGGVYIHHLVWHCLVAFSPPPCLMLGRFLGGQVCHVPDILRESGSMVKRSTQGFEAQHAQNKKIRRYMGRSASSSRDVMIFQTTNALVRWTKALAVRELLLAQEEQRIVADAASDDDDYD